MVVIRDDALEGERICLVESDIDWFRYEIEEIAHLAITDRRSRLDVIFVSERQPSVRFSCSQPLLSLHLGPFEDLYERPGPRPRLRHVDRDLSRSIWPRRDMVSPCCARNHV